MAFRITPATTTEEREAVFRLRYTVLVEEARMASALADYQLRSIEEPMDATARFLVARYHETVVGALRLNLLTEGDWGGEAALLHIDHVREAHPHAIAISGAPIVGAGFRTSATPVRLAVAGYHLILEEGITHDFVAAGRKMESFYQSLGYRAYCGRIRHPERGDVLPMVLALRDRACLESIRSPLVAAEESRIDGANRLYSRSSFRRGEDRPTSQPVDPPHFGCQL